MKIAYLSQMADISTENGISKKIRAQTSHWLRAGHAVRYFSLVPTTAVWNGFTPVETDLLARGNPLNRMRRSLHLAARIRTWRPDVIYFRYAYHSAGLATLFHYIPTVAEINSDDLTEYPITLNRAKLVYHRLTRRRILRSVSGFVPVTRELAHRFAHFGRPAATIANGIDLADFTVAPPPSPAQPMRLIFVGSAATPWHGLDRVAELARLFPDIGFDVVGCTPEHCPAAPASLRFHGHLSRSAYEPLLATATAALGTLGLFRKHMDEACPLKVREYLAAGLPVIGGYLDTDIPSTADYFLRLPNSDAPLQPLRETIAAWLDRWRTHRVSRDDVRQLDNQAKEEQRLAFLTRMARTGSR